MYTPCQETLAVPSKRSQQNSDAIGRPSQACRRRECRRACRQAGRAATLQCLAGSRCSSRGRRRQTGGLRPASCQVPRCAVPSLLKATACCLGIAASRTFCQPPVPGQKLPSAMSPRVGPEQAALHSPGQHKYNPFSTKSIYCVVVAGMHMRPGMGPPIQGPRPPPGWPGMPRPPPGMPPMGPPPPGYATAATSKRQCQAFVCVYPPPHNDCQSGPTL